MFAVYAVHADVDDPLSALRVGEQPEPDVREGWARVKLSHASLNRHDLFTLRGITSHPEGIPFPIILGNDGAGTLDDGTPVVIYPVMGSDDWRGDETLDPHWNIFSERVPGTFADYVAMPKRNAVVLPEGLSNLKCLCARHRLAHSLSGALHQVEAETRTNAARAGCIGWHVHSADSTRTCRRF